MYEAQQAHYYGGLPVHLWICLCRVHDLRRSTTSSCTRFRNIVGVYLAYSQCFILTIYLSVPARAAGLSHRIGLLAEGADADVVLWDAHPLHLGATPRQVWIDGIPQLATPVAAPVKPGRVWQDVPRVPTWDAERAEAVHFEGLPPLAAKKRVSGKVVLSNVQSVWVRTGEEGVKQRWVARNEDERGAVVLAGGQLFCVGPEGHCLTAAESLDADGEDVVLDLRGGSVGPGLLTFGSPLGIEEIAGELSTGDGLTYDPYVQDIPNILNDVGGVVRAADALQFGTRNAL